MEKIKYVGRWIVDNGKVVGNRECDIINKLISTELTFVADRDSGWVRLHRNSSTGIYWELSYPQGELHGGGPPTLETLTEDEVVQRYGRIPRETR